MARLLPSLRHTGGPFRVRSAYGLAWVACALSLSGCITARVDTALNPRVPVRDFETVVVWAGFADLGLQREIEERFTSLGNAAGGTLFIPSYAYLFPGRLHSAEEVAEALASLNADGLLFVAPTSSGTEQEFIPPVVTVSGGQTFVTGGQMIPKPWGNFSARLYDLRAGDVSWFATAAVSGSVYQNQGNVRKRFVREILSHLSRDGFLGGAVHTSASTFRERPSAVLMLGGGLVRLWGPEQFKNDWKGEWVASGSLLIPTFGRTGIRLSTLYTQLRPPRGSILQFSVGPHLTFTDFRGPLSPYLFVTGGYGKVSVGDSPRTGLGADLGLGFRIEGDGVGLFLEGGSSFVFVENPAWQGTPTRLLAARAGLSFPF